MTGHVGSSYDLEISKWLDIPPRATACELVTKVNIPFKLVNNRKNLGPDLLAYFISIGLPEVNSLYFIHSICYGT